ncbi:MAG TPA: cation diffusion facilitator family transporter [Anaeromyxobacteraceae bacterium]|nr:cation diffusion facilitator family transporter [Anaeromyxobacteraceae bacterium]
MQGDHHGHEHGHEHHGHAHPVRGGHEPGADRAAVARRTRRRLALSLVCTAGIMVAEAVGGLVSGSLALLSDAGHMLTDTGALAMALVAAVLASRPADDRRTYGYRRAEVLGAQLNVGALLGLSVWIAWEAIERLGTPRGPINLPVMAIIGLIGLAGNLAILYWLHEEHGVNARSAFLHVLSDAISSVAVLAAAGLMALNPALEWVDPALSLLITVLILYGAARLALEITHILMESVPAHLDVAAVGGAMGTATGVAAVHDLHIWTIASGLYALSAHVVVTGADVGRNDEILDDVKRILRERFAIDHATIQIESESYGHANERHDH